MLRSFRGERSNRPRSPRPNDNSRNAFLLRNPATCSSCSRTDVQIAVELPCGHSFCSTGKDNCLSKLTPNGPSFDCSICEQPNPRLRLEQPQPEYVECGENSRNFYVDFSEMHKNSEPVPAVNPPAQIVVPKLCQTHPGEKMDFWCMGCEQRVCHVCCTDKKHADHMFTSFHNFQKHAKQKVQEKLAKYGNFDQICKKFDHKLKVCENTTKSLREGKGLWTLMLANEAGLRNFACNSHSEIDTGILDKFVQLPDDIWSTYIQSGDAHLIHSSHWKFMEAFSECEIIQFQEQFKNFPVWKQNQAECSESKQLKNGYQMHLEICRQRSNEQDTNIGLYVKLDSSEATKIAHTVLVLYQVKILSTVKSKTCTKPFECHVITARKDETARFGCENLISWSDLNNPKLNWLDNGVMHIECLLHVFMSTDKES